jgi:hypothetical protein
MDPFTISALISGGVQLGTGIYQAVRSSQIEANRPTYEIPDEIKQNLTQAQLNAIEGMPEDVRNRYIDQLTRTMATGLQALGDRRGGIAGVAGLARTATDANRNIAVMDAQQRQQQEANLMNARQTMANYKDKAFDWNERQKYLEEAQAKQALAGSAMQNITGSANNVMGGMMQSKYMDFLKGAYGGGATGNPTAKLEQAGAKSAMGMTDLLAANMLMNSNKQQGTNYLQQQAPPYYGAQFNAPAFFSNQQPNYFAPQFTLPQGFTPDPNISYNQAQYNPFE